MLVDTFYIFKVTKYGSGTKRWDKLTKQERCMDMFVLNLASCRELCIGIYCNLNISIRSI